MTHARMRVTVDAVVESIRCRHFRYSTEDQLQGSLAAALQIDGYMVAREYRLDGLSRLDLFVGDPLDGPGVAIECKTAGSREMAIRQVSRYIGYEEVGGIILVTSRVRHNALPMVIGGKPVRVVQLALSL